MFKTSPKSNILGIRAVKPDCQIVNRERDRQTSLKHYIQASLKNRDLQYYKLFLFNYAIALLFPGISELVVVVDWLKHRRII